MAMSDYNAVVIYDGFYRREDRENTTICAGDRWNDLADNFAWFSAIQALPDDHALKYSLTHGVGHGIIGDRRIRLICYKVGLPHMYELTDDGSIIAVDYCDFPEFKDKYIDGTEWGTLKFEYKGYTFKFKSHKEKKGKKKKPYMAKMTTPNGETWKCKYDYGYEYDK